MTNESLPPIAPVDEFALALPISGQVEILAVILAEAHVIRRPSDQIALSGFEIKTRYSVEELLRENLDDTLRVKLAFELVGNQEGRIEPEFTISIIAKFALVYKLNSWEKIEYGNLHAFAMTNGVFNAWPYWREFVQSTTVRMSLPPIVLPVFRFPTALPSTATAEPEKPGDHP